MKVKLLVLFMMISFVLPAQTQLKGKIIDESGQALPGVNIIVKGSNLGTVSDAEGSFVIGNLSSSSILVFSFIGFSTQEITVGEQTTINVTLATDVRALEEVVVIGYGTQKKGLITGAISSVKTEDIVQTPVLRVEQALQGRIAGIVVTNQSGQPGDAPTVRIRGAGTNGNAEPLYVVDGFPVGGIDFLNPGDIETMSVLKDAASSAIYGARGANGVVLITTKKGTKKALSASYEGYAGIQNPWKKVAVLDSREYMIMMNEGAPMQGTPCRMPM
jgi:TonB-dependent SusC/RagA subfamily outer membrane receptor